MGTIGVILVAGIMIWAIVYGMNLANKNESSEIVEVSSDDNGVIITDVKMKFGSMVIFMVKWVIASIPAFIILLVIGFMISGILGIGAVSIFK